MDVQRQPQHHELSAPLNDLWASPSKSSPLDTAALTHPFERRVVKSWSKALDLPPEAVLDLQSAPEFRYLDPVFRIGRELRLIGGAFEFGLDAEGRFTHYLLTRPEHGELVVKASERLVKSVFDCLPEESLSVALFDPDRLPRDLGNYSPNRLRREVLRVIRDELFPTMVSAMLGHLGSPLGRGDEGFDIRCQRPGFNAETDLIEDVQVKVLREDSPILNVTSEKGVRQFWKLVSVLRAGDGIVIPKLLILAQGARADKVGELEARFVRQGVDRSQIIVLDSEDLRACGFLIKDVYSREDETVYPVRIRMELQQFLRACCAAEFLGRDERIFRIPEVDALTRVLANSFGSEEAKLIAERVAARGPLELQLLEAEGIWALKERLEVRRVFALRRAA